MKNICIAGKNNIAVEVVEFFLENINFYNKINLYIICNTDDKATDNWQKSLKKFALENNLRIISLEEAYNLQDLIFLSLEYDKIIKPSKFINARLYNIHFSLLPKYKGCYTSIWPIINGEKYSGVTLHQIDTGIDTGNIIDYIEFKIDVNDSSRNLYFKYLKYGFKIVTNNLKKIISNSYKSHQQLSIDSSYYSRKSIDFSKLQINFNNSSFQIHNYIRAFIFKEYQLPKFKNYHISASILTNDLIGTKKIVEKLKCFEISGIDSFKIILQKSL